MIKMFSGEMTWEVGQLWTYTENNGLGCFVVKYSSNTDVNLNLRQLDGDCISNTHAKKKKKNT